MAPWRPAVRMALRDLRMHRLRAVLVAALVALPILVATTTSLLHHNLRYEGEKQARITMGAADALVSITRYPRTRLVYQAYDLVPLARPGEFTRSASGRRVPVVRPRSEVSLQALLPQHSRITPAPRNRQVTLSSGGDAQVLELDAAQPMTVGLVSVAAGRAPTGSDEAAVTRPMAEELGMLDTAGDLTGRASLRLAHGRSLHVVGILRREALAGPGARVLVPPGSVVAGARAPKDFLVDLPPLSSARAHDLVRRLAGQGVAMAPRDVAFHPRAWGAQTPPVLPIDPGSLAIGALVVLFGLVEVVLLVGSAFAVGARRQVRDLGLLAASGGSPADVRRVVLAQGLVLGVLGSCLGAAGGVGLFLLATPLYEQVTATTVWTHDISWLAVLGLTALGSVTGLVAALIPAWSIGRLTPLAALSGRFPVRPGESAAHRPAFALAGTGLLVLALGGVWTAQEFAQPVRKLVGSDDYVPPPSSLPVVVTGLGVLLLLAAALWSAPYVVRRVAGLGRCLPLSGRFAFRDAARHRFRTAASAVALTTTVAGAVVACFTVGAVQAGAAADSSTPHRSMFVDLYNVKAGQDQQVADVLATVRRTTGPGRTYLAYDADRRAVGGDAVLALRLGAGVSGNLTVVDEPTLSYLTGGDARAAATYAAGGVVTMMPHAVRRGHVNVALFPGQRKPENRWSLAATTVATTTAAASGNLSTSWISPATATRLGLVAKPDGALVLTPGPVTSDQLARLAVYGIDAWSGDTDTEQLKWVGLGAVAAAGLLTALVAGIAIALAAAEGRSDVATFAAVGAGPWRRRGLGAMHGVLLGLVGVLLGAGIGIPASLALTQVNGISGVQVPWLSLCGLLVVVPLLAAGAGWVVTPTRLSLVRRTA